MLQQSLYYLLLATDFRFTKLINLTKEFKTKVQFSAMMLLMRVLNKNKNFKKYKSL